jgi:hypothetical protein
MGFRDDDEFVEETERLLAALSGGEPLTPLDWTRIVLATELVFASNVIGSGVEWPITTGLSDEATIRLLRSVQRKVVGMTSAVVYESLGARRPPRRPTKRG